MGLCYKVCGVSVITEMAANSRWPETNVEWQMRGERKCGGLPATFFTY
uniref:MIP31759p n=1 Tax=Drosophila melanogaster TaxID=7227 RepID=F7VJT6_DROME|nr:MIP31759p [Drosophila melanogaster]